MACPICQSPSTNGFFPFCSRVCKNSDLLGWLNEQYRVPVEDFIEAEEDGD